MSKGVPALWFISTKRPKKVAFLILVHLPTKPIRRRELRIVTEKNSSGIGFGGTTAFLRYNFRPKTRCSTKSFMSTDGNTYLIPVLLKAASILRRILRAFGSFQCSVSLVREPW